jgi:hypothetical protein
MFVRLKFIIIVYVSLSIATLLSGCNETKVAQCERLTEVINHGTSLIQKNKGYQVTTSVRLAKDLGNVNKSLKRMSFQDAKLKEYQDSFVKVFETFSKEITKAAKALGSTKNAKISPVSWKAIQKDRSTIETSLTKAATAAKQSDSLESKVKQYCSQP